MAKSFVTTPIVGLILRGIALVAAKCLRWKMPSKIPDVKKAVFIGAPHTSNWDFFVMLMGVLIYRLDVKWIGKHTLFKGPLGPIMRWLGGIPINRTIRGNFVQQMVDHFNNTDDLLLVIAPEGTRKLVEKWHSGFYYMAYNAGVPIVLATVDYKKREVTVDKVEYPTGDADADIQRYQAFYTTVTGKNPYNYFGYKPQVDADNS